MKTKVRTKPTVHTSVVTDGLSPTNTILTDVDGVLLHWGLSFDAFMASEGYTKKEDSDHHYRLSLQYPELTDRKITKLVEKFNTSEAIKELPPWKDAVYYVRKLHSLGYNFVCITALSEHQFAREYREYNLTKVFGKGIFHHDHMICLPVGASKHAALSPWAGMKYWWIEDHFRHAESGYELGMRSVLMDNPHNTHFKTDLFPRVSSWKEIYNMIVSNDYPSP